MFAWVKLIREHTNPIKFLLKENYFENNFSHGKVRFNLIEYFRLISLRENDSIKN